MIKIYEIYFRALRIDEKMSCPNRIFQNSDFLNVSKKNKECDRLERIVGSVPGHDTNNSHA